MALVHVSRAETSRRELTADGPKISGGANEHQRICGKENHSVSESKLRECVAIIYCG